MTEAKKKAPAKKPEPKSYTYNGGPASVTVHLPSGRELSVGRGDTVDLEDPTDRRAVSSLPDWSPVKSSPPESTSEVGTEIN